MGSLGFPMFSIEESIDANDTLAEVVKSKEIRYLEGFPLLLANSIERSLYYQKEVEDLLKSKNEKNNFKKLILMSLALYAYLKIKLQTEELYSSEYFDTKVFDQFLLCFKKKQDLTWNKIRLSSTRIVNTFRNYYKQAEFNLRDYLNTTDEFDFEYALSKIFSGKQKELFIKKLKGEKMTKTEREYYSRSVKKKVLALANSDLHKLSLKLLK